MRKYGRLLTSIWSDPDWLQLDVGSQRFYLMLVSQPKLSLAGVVDLVPKRWARSASDCNVDEIERCLKVLEEARFVVVDRVAEEVLVRSLVRHDVGSGPRPSNLVKGFWSAWEQVASDVLRKVIVDELPDQIADHSKVELPVEAKRMSRSGRLKLPISWSLEYPLDH